MEMEIESECGEISTNRLVTPEKPNSENALVSELINRATHEWNMDNCRSGSYPKTERL